MKKQILSVATIGLLSASLLITSCAKDDVTAPVISLVGDASVTISLNSTYTDAGATATDDEDGDVTVNINVTNPVNKDKTGTYTVTYTVSDAAGNEGTATRTVIVKNDSESLAGNYNVVESYPGTTDPDYSYTQIVSASETVNNRITFNKFGDYSGNTGIYANVTGTNIDLPSQSAVGIGTNSQNHTFSGTGTTNSTGFVINFADVNTSVSASAAVTATFTKQ